MNKGHLYRTAVIKAQVAQSVEYEARVGPHSVSSVDIYTFVVSRAFMTVAARPAGYADSSRAPGLTSGLQGSVNVHRGAPLLVPLWQSISSFLFYTLGCGFMSHCRQEFFILYFIAFDALLTGRLFPYKLYQAWHLSEVIDALERMTV